MASFAMNIGAIIVIIGAIIGLYTRIGSGIEYRPYTKGDAPGAHHSHDEQITYGPEDVKR